ncbi:hypothetical protein CK203_015346 [Vitis vinifera]|uniref:Retrovirus-related Pol polyprotein from transposon RE2 n=1 Tax=Vitis vinifera TaxID=29760 RepID=A0A438JJZ2_VITVI|nr:hypothetical protein CK203_015346 [Vitis vinifera]
MTTKNQIFTSVLSGSPLITSEKLVGSENYLSWSALLNFGLWVKDMRITWLPRRQISLSQQDLDLSTYIGQIASLKEQFLTVMPLTPDVGGVNKTQLNKFFMVLTLIGLRPDLEPIRDQILVVHHFSNYLSRRTHGTRGRGQRPHCTYCNKLATLAIVAISYMEDLPRTAHMAQSSDSPLPQPPSSSASQTSQASIASVAQPGIGLALPLPSLPLTSVLYTPECPFNLISISKLTRTLNCSITFSDKFVTLQDRSTGKTIGIGRESQGLYHLTSDSSPAVCISTDALSSFTIVWVTLVSPSSRRWFLVFPLCRRFRVSHVSLGNILVFSFPKRLE